MPELTRSELAGALRDAAKVAHGDDRHDLGTALDVLARDHRPDLREPWAQKQLADAVVAYTGCGRRHRTPTEAAQAWRELHCRDLDALLQETAGHVERSAREAA